VSTRASSGSSSSGTSTMIDVPGPQPYQVFVGEGLLAGIADRLPRLVGDGVRRVLVVHPTALAAVGSQVCQDLERAGYRAVPAQVPDGEPAKTAAVAASLWEVLGQAGFTRTDVVLGVGGGATTDLAGFVAASWLRGVRVVQVPTTLAGMVDAAVGGKTGINTAEGKNLVGAFHPPAAVICDLTTLRTLPHKDFVAGLAEVVKCGLIADPEILRIIEADFAAVTAWRSASTRELVERSVRIKADVVGRDLHESGPREVLNYGHTFGHAVEQVEGYTWRHGEAVSVGLVFAAELARLAGRLAPAVARRHRQILTGLGLPTRYRQDRWDELLVAIRRDKKSRGDLLRFVVLEDVGRPARLEGPATELLRAAYAELA
jgi:3-dehydroquinate synthase